MYNLHCHSLHSDGVLLPSEVAMRYMAKGYKVIAITDHADYSNIKTAADAITSFCSRWPKKYPIKVLPGVELTHVPLDQFKPLAALARKRGIKIVVAHGETVVEPVVPGTNRAALESDIDILAHPGQISDKDVLLAKEKGIFLEITSRSGHGESNSHVAARALALGARLILNTDGHRPEDIITPEELRSVGLSSGISESQLDNIYKVVEGFLHDKGCL